MALTATEEKQAEILTKAITELAERVIGHESCGCGSPSDALHLFSERVKMKHIDGVPVAAVITDDSYVALCARCAAAMGDGGDA